VHTYTHYKLDTTDIHACARKYWQESNIHRYGVQKATADQSDDDFCIRSDFHLPKSSAGLHIDAKKIREQSSRGAKVPFEAKHMPKSQQICMFAKMMNFPVERTEPRGNQCRNH